MKLWMNFFAFSVLGFFAHLEATTSATQTVNFSVATVESISVSGNPGPLNIPTTVTTFPASVSDSSTTYDVTSNVSTAQRISAVIDTEMPTDTSLTVSMAPPSGATSTPVILTTTPQTAISNILPIVATGLTITYTFTAQAIAGPIASTSRVVTFTVEP